MTQSATTTDQDEMILAPICSIFRRFLKNHGLKFTLERAAILDTVLTKEGLFEAEALLDDVREAGYRVSKATIYRTIKHLVEAGIIQEVLIESKQAHYQLIYGRKPMDHVVCMDDDQVTGFYSPELIDLVDKICREHGLEPVGHRFLIYGVKKKEEAETSS